MVEFLVLFILILALTLIITKYKEHQEKYILQSVAHIIDNGYMHNNQIHVVDLCRFSDSDDVNEAYLFFQRLQNKGKIKDSMKLIGTNSVGSYRRFENERKGEIEEYNKTTEVAM
jgi:hypothetical protein